MFFYITWDWSSLSINYVQTVPTSGIKIDDELKNQNFRFAKNKLMRLSYYFNELDRSAQHNAWLNIWNIS